MKKKLFAVGMAILIALGTLPMSTVLALSTSDYAYSSGENEARILISSADHSMGAVVTDTGDGNFDAPDDVWSFTANAAEGFRFDHWETSGSEYVNQSLDDNVLSISFKAVLEPDEIYSAKAVFAPIEDIESDPSLQNSQFSEPVGSAQTSPLSNPSKDSEKLTDENPAGNDGAGLMCIGHNDKYKLNVYCMGYPAGGWVTVSPPSSNGRYPAGTVVTLSATPNRHSVFRGFYTKSHSRGSYFTGRLSSPEITMDGNKTIYALFGSKNYRFDHIDVWMAGKLTIEHRINGEFISKETINVRTSEVSATYVVDGQSYEVPNNKFIGCRNEWRALGLSFPWPDSITIRATLTNVNGPSETYDFEHTFGQAGLEEAYARCPGSEWWGTKGFDFVLTENVIENSITHTVTFAAGSGGTLEGANAGGEVVMSGLLDNSDFPTAPTPIPDENHVFDKWSPSLPSTVTQDGTYIALFKPNTYTVTFVDYDGSVIDTQTVEHGAAATAPAEPEREGYTFAGWDVAFDNVTSDLTVTAEYAINTYTVTFVDYDGTVLDEQTVEHGTAATAPAEPEREGYTFTGWDVAFDNVTSDLTVTAQYAINTYTVTFVDYDGTELSTQTVEHGTAATAPEEPEREGYTFTGWDIAFDSVTTDLTVTAQYELVIPTYTLNMTVVGQGSVAAMSATYPQGTVVNLLDIEATPAEGWQFTEWQDANGHSITSVTMDSDKEVFVVFSERTGTDDERTGTDDELTGTDNERTGTDNELMESANELTELNEELVEIGEEDVPEVPATADSTNAPSWYWWLLAVPAGLLLWWLLWLWFSVVPVAEQVVGNGDGTYTIQWGYKNRKLRRYKTDPQKSKLSLLLGKLLNVEPNPPVEFQKGEHSNVFTSTVSEDSILMWEINGSKKKVDISKYKK